MFSRNLTRSTPKFSKQFLPKRGVKSSTVTSAAEDDFSMNGPAVCYGTLLGSAFGAYHMGLEYDRREVSSTILGSIVGGMGGAMAGAAWPLTGICLSGVGIAYAMDNMPKIPVYVSFKPPPNDNLQEN